MEPQTLTCKNCGEPIKVIYSPNSLSHFIHVKPRQNRVCDHANPREMLQ